MSPRCGIRSSECSSKRLHSDRGGNIPWSHSWPGSHCVPGAIWKGPMSGVVSTVVRLKASDVSRRSRWVAAGERKSRCHGWSTAPGNGTSKPTSTIW
jgi:hypothetical protein